MLNDQRILILEREKEKTNQKSAAHKIKVVLFVFIALKRKNQWRTNLRNRVRYEFKLIMLSGKQGLNSIMKTTRRNNI